MSEAVERKLVALLGHPTTSPYGNPIPGLDKLGEGGKPAPSPEPGLVRVDEVARRGGGSVEVRRIAEHVQIDEELMAELKTVGLIPGNTVQVQGGPAAAAVIEVHGLGAVAKIDAAVAHAVLVTAR